uniref:uncharacterized protein LOC120344296 n=1 Tax=Styela clava TaxID=7725 RepID=UPI0019394229|nr:uncharacterized protein LOC120344296 [Styela clava]
MVLNMDTELQRLICVSVEKMTRDPAASGSRKSRGLDLRKALLVAHVLQDMRSAYISDDYQVLANTVCPDIDISSENEMDKIKRTISRREYDNEDDLTSYQKRRFISDDWSSGTIERPPRSEGNDTPFLTSQYRCPSGTQSCLVTCSDATMSKISQMTHPIPVSINTTYVLSPHLTNEKDNEEIIDMDEDTPAVSEQVEVTSSDISDSESVEIEVVQCDDLLNNPQSPETIVDNKSEITVNTDLTKSQGNNRPSISCPLPRKKRPLPKEFLEPTVNENTNISTSHQPINKRTKYDVTVTSSTCDVVVTSSYFVLNTTTATTLTQSTALSKSRLSPASQTGASQSCLTLTSSVCTSSLSSTSTANTLANSNSKPKVVVELMNNQSSSNGHWSLPVTCTQPRLSQWIMDGVYRAQLADISNMRDNSIHNVGMRGLVAY